MNQMYIGQYQRLEQRLTPQQILLSTLLQLPLLSLEQRIKGELEQNPVLEEGMDNEQEEMPEDEEQTKEVEEELNLHDQAEKGEEYKDKEFELAGFGPIRWLDDGSGYTTLESSQEFPEVKNIIKYDPENGWTLHFL